MNNVPKLSTVIPCATGAFSSLLAGMKRGAVLSDLDAAMSELVQACTETGKSGTLSLKIKIEPDGKSNAESPVFAITDEISIKKPRKGRGKALFFGDSEGNLFRDDPKQAEMQLEEVPRIPAQIAPPNEQQKSAAAS